MQFVKVISNQFDEAKRNIIKFLRFGKSDIQTSVNVQPAQVDACPIKDMIAIYAETSTKGDTVIIGYVNKNQKALSGEFRIFAQDDNGIEKTYIHLKKSGIIEIAGNTDNAVRYIALNTALQAQANAINIELGKIASVLNSIIPGSYVVTPITINITASKINEIKTT